MGAQSEKFLFVARVVLLGETGSDQPTICSDLEISRLLLHRLEVLAAAMRQVEILRSTAANAPEQ
jgi:hypothetical protein